ncbi:hypothetical protein Cst_c00800 [Thermoclostridium stercorarium subsp. stercorarium DSM 8532]|uniref:Uncharacterized protein n=1 Tax=Thermoclostridium stercorarium (strain ATCC 35414 / DSM 8532 / NCIMB 11754) TaxID=1121335 RepID=L7VKW6_THES1|nr:hypothetical protein Cst_c00800 [Thermoclostridium stercorarium subsp. stercorarium DSM 8532]AGI38191.1 hypothetical protein Clst_0075 [Thermoclostridium stercorarium subsp. stercorarium DSM 8532]
MLIILFQKMIFPWHRHRLTETPFLMSRSYKAVSFLKAKRGYRLKIA